MVYALHTAAHSSSFMSTKSVSFSRLFHTASSGVIETGSSREHRISASFSEFSEWFNRG